MKNLFYCVYDGVVHQGRFSDLYFEGTLQIERKFTGAVLRHGNVRGSDRFILAGVGNMCSSRTDAPRRIYETLEDCRNDRNGMGYNEFANQLAMSMFGNVRMEISENCALPDGIVPEVEYLNDYNGKSEWRLKMPFWTWNGVMPEKNYLRSFHYHVFSGRVEPTMFTNHELMSVRCKYGVLYATEEDCREDNVVEVVCFPDEEC